MIRQTVLGFKLGRTGEALTAHGGLALMAEFCHRLKLGGLVNEHLPAPGSNRGYEPSVFVEALILMLMGGGCHLDDLRELKEERGLLGLMGCEVIPDAATVGDWLRRMGDPGCGQKGLMGLGEVRDGVNKWILGQEARKGYTLDVDAVQIEGEKREAQFTYKGEKGYMPMLGFLFETPVCLYDEFWEGNVSPGWGHADFYGVCKSRMPAGKRIERYRADSASYDGGLINALNEDGVMWAITADKDSAVKRAIAGIAEENWKEPVLGCGYEVGETVHTMERTKRAFRLIVKRELRQVERDLFGEERRYFYHAIASNFPMEEKGAYDVLVWHQQRGQAEHFNKELKSGFGMGQMPCGERFANAVFFRIGVIAYNLFIGFKQLCPGSWARHTIGTFRWKMVQIAGRIVHHAGQVFLRLAGDGKRCLLFEEIRRRCFELREVT